jgi:ribonuclease P/MRP protein subunit RPP40
MVSIKLTNFLQLNKILYKHQYGFQRGLSTYLTNRYLCVEVNNHGSSRAPVGSGVFQGSILGPLLFLCYTNEIHSATELTTFLFTDDTSCLAEHKNLHTLIIYVNTERQKIAVWFKASKMAVNVSKTI